MLLRMPPGQSTWRFGGMAFREVAVTEIREVLRAWLAGAGRRAGRLASSPGVMRRQRGTQRPQRM